MSGIEPWLPRYDVSERHETAIALAPDQALERVLATPVAPDGLVRSLMRLRGLRPDGSIEAFLSSHGFLLLERAPRSYVVGLCVGRSGAAVTDPAGWAAPDRPPSIRVVTAFLAEPAPGGARVVTETRVAATGRAARVAFGLYWFVVGPWSALIRRRWLAAAARLANA